jgi:hypothetical protein
VRVDQPYEVGELDQDEKRSDRAVRWYRICVHLRMPSLHGISHGLAGAARLLECARVLIQSRPGHCLRSRRISADLRCTNIPCSVYAPDPRGALVDGNEKGGKVFECMGFSITVYGISFHIL